MPATPTSLADYLAAVAQKATLSATDKGVIAISLKTLLTRLRAEFDKYDVSRLEAFGAFTRDTSLPPAMDRESDVDVMAVFTEAGRKPAYFIEKLKQVALLHYPRPSIAHRGHSLYIELLHTRFDLVPALDSLRGLQIPDKRGDGWQPCEDGGKALRQKDAQNAGLILPLLRLAKYWNARNEHPLDAFALEQRIAAHSFAMAPKNLKAYFFDFMRGLSTLPLADVAKAERVRALRRALDDIDRTAQGGDMLGAVAKMEAILPLPLPLPPAAAARTAAGTDNPFLRRPPPG